MFQRNEGGAGDTVIAQGVKVEGDFTSSGNVIIEGDVTGSVATTGDLQVGPSARIEADVTAANATVAGEVHGNITIEGQLDLASTSRIQGDIQTASLIVASGSVVNGRVSMKGTQQPPRKKDEQEKEPVDE